jgi:hypothetical protein
MSVCVVFLIGHKTSLLLLHCPAGSGRSTRWLWTLAREMARVVDMNEPSEVWRDEVVHSLGIEQLLHCRRRRPVARSSLASVGSWAGGGVAWLRGGGGMCLCACICLFIHLYCTYPLSLYYLLENFGLQWYCYIFLGHTQNLQCKTLTLLKPMLYGSNLFQFLRYWLNGTIDK